MSETEEYQESIFEKIMVPLMRYQEAQFRLFALNLQVPLPPEYQLRKNLYQAQMLAADNEIKQLINPE